METLRTAWNGIVLQNKWIMSYCWQMGDTGLDIIKRLEKQLPQPSRKKKIHPLHMK